MVDEARGRVEGQKAGKEGERERKRERYLFLVRIHRQREGCIFGSLRYKDSHRVLYKMQYEFKRRDTSEDEKRSDKNMKG